MFALLSASALLPGGTEDGVRMLLQPTSTLLALGVGTTAVLAAVVLIRAAEFLPLRARQVSRAVFLVLGLYAALAFGLAVYGRESFAALFHGAAAWHPLPRWLQGTMLGGLVLIPLALVAQMVHLVRRRIRRQPLRSVPQQALALLMAGVTAVSGLTAGAPGSLATLVSGAAAATGAPPRDAIAAIGRAQEDFEAAVSGATDRGADEGSTQVATLRRAFNALERTMAALPRDTFDAEFVVQQANGNPRAMFEWVRDHTYWVPYHGSLRGEVGVLQDRVGNSLDRSLLLMRLLELSGRRARLAHRVLSDDEASSMLHGLPKAPPSPASAALASADAAIKGIHERLANDLGVSPSRLESLAAASEAARRAFVTGLEQLAEPIGDQLMRAVGGDQPTEEGAGASAIADHWWVQWEDGGRWLDMDPMAQGGVAGTAVGPPGETLHEVPGSLLHTVRIDVVIEQAKAGRLAERVVLSRTLVPSEVIGQRVLLQHVPGDPIENSGADAWQAAAGVKAWTPTLTIDAEKYTERGFSTTGEVTAANATSRRGAPAAVPDLSGFLGGGGGDEAKTEASEGSLTAEWLDYVIHVPGATDRRVRRQVFDLLGPAARAASRLPPDVLPEAKRVERGLALLGDTSIVALPCFPSPQYVLWLNARAMLANQELLLRVVGGDPSAGGARLDSLLARATPFPGPAYELAASRLAFEGSAHIYIASPNVLAYHRSHRQISASEMASFEAFDIVANDVSVRAGASSSPFEGRLRQGVLDTLAEAYALPEGCCGERLPNAATEMAASPAPWTVVKDTSEIGSLGLPEDMEARLASDIAQGYVVLVQPQSNTPAWWRIDPRSGMTIGMGGDGWGQGGLEYAAKLAVRVGLITFCTLNADKIKDPLKRDIAKLGCGLAGGVAFIGAFLRASWIGLAADLLALGFAALSYHWNP
ncbi:MAG TPA: hypothetical protein VK911_06785 [Vicinamibacterales bacterium]|nr:hypothetical protein [Vicinamibacterales bacterium]